MNYLAFVIAGLAATLLGYGFGWALNERERDGAQQEAPATIIVLIVLVGTALLAVSGVIYLATNLQILSLIASPILLVVGFQFGHPAAAQRMRQFSRAVRDITLTFRK